MIARLALLGGLLTMAAPAYAGVLIPTPEAGVGLAAMAALGAGYAFLRRKTPKR